MTSRKPQKARYQPLLPIPLATRFLTTNFSTVCTDKVQGLWLSVTDTERPPDWTAFPES